MKQADFDLSKAEWDRFKAFHIGHGPGYDKPIVQFDTGEVIFTQHRWEPDQRKLYRDFNITVVSTADVRCPLLYRHATDEKPVPKARLNQTGQQIILIDHDHGIAVSLEFGDSLSSDLPRREFQERLPERLRAHAFAYYAGPKSVPISRGIDIWRPRVFGKMQEEHLTELVCASRAWCDLQGEGLSSTRLAGTDKTDRREPEYLLEKTFNNLSIHERYWLAKKGIIRGQEAETVPWLCVR